MAQPTVAERSRRGARAASAAPALAPMPELHDVHRDRAAVEHDSRRPAASTPSRRDSSATRSRSRSTPMSSRSATGAGSSRRCRGCAERTTHRIDYRHVIWWLVRKPGAFARYRYREELFPSLMFRRAYDALRERARRPRRRRVRPHPAPRGEHDGVDGGAALAQLLERGGPLRLRRGARRSPRPRCPPFRTCTSRAPDLAAATMRLLARRCAMSAARHARRGASASRELLATLQAPHGRAELVARFDAGRSTPALPLLLEVLELEAGERRERRIDRLRRASKLPPGKTFDTLDEQRLPRPLAAEAPASSRRRLPRRGRQRARLRPARRRQEPRDVRARPRARPGAGAPCSSCRLPARPGAARGEAGSRLAAGPPATRRLRRS